MYAVRIGGMFVVLFTILVLVLYALFRQDSLQEYLRYEEMPNSAEPDVNALNIKINEINMKREVRNWKKYGPPVRETVTIIIRVHKNIRGLQYLIVSLAQVRYIESALLVFSHSYYSEHMNRLIDSVDFCKVMQIFYPHSVQLHPNHFPGIDLEDCIVGSQTSTSRDCPRRDAAAAERKHHWWWTANFIFDRLPWSARYTGTVIFLEEDQYVSPDLLHMLQYVQRSLSYFPDVEIMSLGTMYANRLDPRLLTLEYWRPPYDVGIAFNKTTWKKILDLSSFYCMYDDCSWSYSLLNVFKNFPNGNVNMVACVAPRVISSKQFDSDECPAVLFDVFSNLELFPEKVKAVYLFGPNGRLKANVEAPPRGNGGWTNIKDHLLCLDPLAGLTAEGNESTSAPRYDLYTGK